MKIYDDKLLTEDEINNFTDVLIPNTPAAKWVDHSLFCDERFNNAMEYVRSNDKFRKMTIEQIFKWFYLLGVNTDVCSKEVSFEEIVNFLDNANFVKTVSAAISDPNNMPENTIISVDDKNNLIRLEAVCEGYDCACSPQREDHCMSEEPDKCVITIPMKQFNKMIGVDESNNQGQVH